MTHEEAAERPDALEPQWQDALPSSPKLLVFLRPKGLRADKVYGPMLQRALELAREQRVTSGALVLDAIEELIRTIRLIEGVTRTETMVVLSTHTERTHITVPAEEPGEPGNGRRHRHGALKNGLGDFKRT